MKKILLVCTGNTCRSSMAEALLKRLLEERTDHLKDIFVSSAGTYAVEGDRASSHAIIVMEERGLSLEEHRSSPLSQDLLEEADLVLTMTIGHKRAILQVVPYMEDKVYTLKEYIGDNSLDITDPYGQSLEIYRKCSDEIYQCLSKLLDKLEK
ncbi:low molecular weight protein arginine phosphatase [Alkaliphilus transvaalensis]|uniref:low molecular weight protein arginine phosphatase n=1 Tax=Alkaliphilus transvaalensis TaxID=114628 RepID=UPI00047AA98D|nr:low molecular weight protein arginine phosphatase [Alkaliphilus transvaalensis]